MRISVLGCVFLLGSLSSAATLAQAQSFSTAPCTSNDGDSDGGWFGHQQRVCEMRRATLPLVNGQLGVMGKNGGIEVIGEDRNDIALEVKVTANGSSRENADSILHQVRLVVQGSNIRAEGPTESGGGWFHGSGWSANFRLHVPHRIAQAELHTSNGSIHVTNLDGRVNATSNNGGIEVAHVRGDVTASSTNGGLHLDDLAGAVHAETTNGGVQISLAGSRWQGSGLFAKSTNGAISLKAPDRFAAHLIADTTNGGISVGFPITVQGKIGRHIDTDINGGGPTVHLETTNGGVSIDHS